MTKFDMIIIRKMILLFFRVKLVLCSEYNAESTAKRPQCSSTYLPFGIIHRKQAETTRRRKKNR